jgi:hypothetical protein
MNKQGKELTKYPCRKESPSYTAYPKKTQNQLINNFPVFEKPMKP